MMENSFLTKFDRIYHKDRHINSTMVTKHQKIIEQHNKIN